MDKFINNPWVTRVLALLFALMLFLMVNFQSSPAPKQTGTALFPTVTTDEVTLTNIPVTAYFNSENNVVTGLPQEVNVTLKGPTSSITTERNLKDFEIYAELNDLEIGTHRVKLLHKNISDDLDVSINPSTVTVTIQEKVTREFSVEVDFTNEEKMKEGYTPQQPITKPNIVRITGAKDIVDRIALVKARVNLQDVDETITQESRITVYDSEGNILPVEVDPSVVEINVPVTSPSKKVPFKVIREGELEEGLSISSLETEPNEITIYGPQDVLEKIEYLDGVKVDLSKIKEDTVLEAEIPLPEGVTKLSQDKVSIDIKVAKEEEKVLTDIPVQTLGLEDEKQVEFVDPEMKSLDLSVLGAPKVINELEPEDIELYVNVTDLAEGEHSLKVEVNGPQNIKWTLPKDEVTVTITSKLAENQGDSEEQIIENPDDSSEASNLEDEIKGAEQNG